MEINEESMTLISQKLRLFRDYRGFPSNTETLDAYAQIVCRIVHNKPCYEIIKPLLIPGLHDDITEEYWYQKHAVKPGTTDTDALFDLLLENIDGWFPFPPTIRAYYEKLGLEPADGKNAVIEDED